MNKLQSIYAKVMYDPGTIGIFINPFYFLRKGIIDGISANKKYLKGKMMDFGCGTKPYKNILDVEEYIGVDIELPDDKVNNQVDVYYDGKTMPFKTNYFESVLASEVFEHIFNLEEILGEIFRVLKPGGHMVATLPFAWDEHGVPYDFARYTSFGINHLLKEAGFYVVKIEKSTNYVEAIFQMWNAFVFQHVFPENSLLKVILTPIFIAPTTLLGMFLAKILPENRNYYNNNIVVARKPTRRKIVVT